MACTQKSTFISGHHFKFWTVENNCWIAHHAETTRFCRCKSHENKWKNISIEMSFSSCTRVKIGSITKAHWLNALIHPYTGLERVEAAQVVVAVAAALFLLQEKNSSGLTISSFFTIHSFLHFYHLFFPRAVRRKSNKICLGRKKWSPGHHFFIFYHSFILS